MRRSARLLVLGSATALAIAMPAATTWFAGAAGAAAVPVRAASPRVMFTMTIKGIDRNGTPLSNPNASVFGVNGVNYLSGGNSVKVPAGTYEVAASIQTAGSDSQTLVAKTVHVTGNTTVTLDAQGSVALSASLTGASGSPQQGDQTLSLCIGSGPSPNEVTGFLVDSAGQAYVKPMTASVLRTVYQTFWQDTTTGTTYDVAGAHFGGIPGATVYHADPSTMATVHVQLRNFENVTPLQPLIETYDGCGTTTLPEVSVPDSYTDFRTPGHWTTNLNFGPTQSQVQRDLFKSATYKANHTYTDLFGSAVAGPAADFPTIDGHDVVYSPVNQFSDPVVGLGFDCEGQSGVSLYHGATLVGSQNITFCNAPDTFTHHVSANGWYTMYSRALRFNPTGSVPSTILSEFVDMTWRFRFAPVTGHPINAQAAPVTVTRFQPQGLGLNNDAHGGGMTTVRFVIVRGGGQPVPTPRYRLKKVRVQASFNNGVTWQTVAISPHVGYWLAQVPAPPNGAFVSLRSIITDVHGDSTTETIIRAYRVDTT